MIRVAWFQVGVALLGVPENPRKKTCRVSVQFLFKNVVISLIFWFRRPMSLFRGSLRRQWGAGVQCLGAGVRGFLGWAWLSLCALEEMKEDSIPAFVRRSGFEN